MDIFLENFRSSDTKEHVFFNPLSTSHTATCKTDFLKGDLNFFILRNTGFGLTKKDIPNDKIDLSLQYLFIGSIFNHLNIHPVTYQGENAGRIFRTVTPLKKFEHMKSSFGGIERQESIYLESGDFLIFKNQKVAHARKPFTPKYNGYDRLLIRTFGINNLNRISRVNANNPYYAVSH